MLQTAKALCASLSMNPSEIRKAKRTLKHLLQTMVQFPTHHEEVLRALIQIYSAEGTVQGKRIGLRYASQLKQYVLAEKQASFSIQLGADSLERGGKDLELLPGLFFVGPPPSCHERMAHDSELQLGAICDSLADVRKSVNEERFISGAYAVAENWALAAEFSTEGSGRHCFRVGKLASAIAFTLGMDMRSCVELDLACRLHDIGNIVVYKTCLRRPRQSEFNCFKSQREHTAAGAHLLGCSSDPVLMLASGIARYHHEWWNGCGYPEGLRGEEIPLAARICAFADAYDTLTNADGDHLAWTHGEAVQQICAMAGVQLDPNLIAPFLESVDGDVSAKEHVAREVDCSMERNQLLRAKKKLFEALELID